jgi:4-amino-4-deoxy-L-arabinose transferase-like glycosyltransferase
MMRDIANPGQNRSTKPRWAWWRYLHLILPLLFFVAMYLFFPYREQFEFDPDEGLNAMKALLVARGYPLYSQVWSDQPPLFTYLLAVSIRFFGHDVDAARTLVLLLSTLLLVAVAQFLRFSWGHWHAIAGPILIVLLPFYTTLSVSVMLAVPVLAFAMLSLMFLTMWHKQRQTVWLVFSAITLGLSILTKLLTAFLAPIFILGLLLADKSESNRSMPRLRWIRTAFLWSLVFIPIALGLMLLLVGPGNLNQLFATHLSVPNDPEYVEFVGPKSISVQLLESWPYLPLVLLGCLFTLMERRWLTLYVLAWAAVAYLLLFFYAPNWYHHQLLVTIPLALLAAIAAGESIQRVPELLRSRTILGKQGALATLGIAGFVLVLAVRAPLILPDFYRPPIFLTKAAHAPWWGQIFLTKMTNHAPETHWAVTDLPMYAFRAGVLVPPAMAVISDKRMSSGELNEGEIIRIIQEYNPEQVLWGRYRLPTLEAYLAGHYRLLYVRHNTKLYIREDLGGP